MLSELLQDRAALYAAGVMSAAERESFELLLEFHEELRAEVASLQKVATAVWLAGVKPAAAAPAELKARILGALGPQPRPPAPDGLVVADAAGLIEWVNPAFTALCGYTLDEIKGRKPGQFLQGPRTDPTAVARIRQGVRERRPCRETLANYHKDGSLYYVDIAITPILDDDGQPLWFIAKEKKVDAA